LILQLAKYLVIAFGSEIMELDLPANNRGNCLPNSHAWNRLVLPGMDWDFR